MDLSIDGAMEALQSVITIFSDDDTRALAFGTLAAFTLFVVARACATNKTNTTNNANATVVVVEDLHARDIEAYRKARKEGVVLVEKSNNSWINTPPPSPSPTTTLTTLTVKDVSPLPLPPSPSSSSSAALPTHAHARPALSNLSTIPDSYAVSREGAGLSASSSFSLVRWHCHVCVMFIHAVRHWIVCVCVCVYV
jgi:hypothetical protein